MVRTDDTFLDGKPQIVKKAEKTLGWPTILTLLIKLTVLIRRGFLTFRKDWMHIRSLSALF